MGIYDNDIKRDIEAIYSLLDGVKPSKDLKSKDTSRSSTVLLVQVRVMQ